MSKILLVEDETHVADLIKKGLEEEGYSVSHANDGVNGLSMFKQQKYDLVVLDILLPAMNGLDVCKQIRQSEKNDVPVLMLTALNSAENVVLGLDSGADDYLAKPFKLIELNARIRNLLRRKEYVANSIKTESIIYKFEDVEVNDSSKMVLRSGNEISLTSTEYRLLLTFIKNPLKVLSRIELLEQVWGIDYDIGTNVVDVYVNYLRKKLDKYGTNKLIHTVIGMGYILKSE